MTRFCQWGKIFFLAPGWLWPTALHKTTKVEWQ